MVLKIPHVDYVRGRHQHHTHQRQGYLVILIDDVRDTDEHETEAGGAHGQTEWGRMAAIAEPEGSNAHGDGGRQEQPVYGSFAAKQVIAEDR